MYYDSLWETPTVTQLTGLCHMCVKLETHGKPRGGGGGALYDSVGAYSLIPHFNVQIEGEEL